MKLKIDRSKQIVQGDKKVIRAWVMYDWSNSVFQLTVLSVVFPVFYEKMTSAGGSSIVSFFGFNIINSVLYSWAIALSYLVVAGFSPFFSSIADYTGRRRGFMRFFTFLGALSCGMLFFFTPTTIEFGMIAFVLATIGYTGSIVFYNSFLPVIAAPEDQDRISANGFAMGYLGGVILLLLNLAMIMKPSLFGIIDKTLPARISFVTVCVWWLGFSSITFLKLPKYTLGNRSKKGKTLIKGYSELKKVFQQVKSMPQLRIFLFAYLFMIMGVLNVMFMAAMYGKKELHLDDTVLIPIILLIQLLGMVGAWMFVKISKRIGNVKSLIFSTIGWILVIFGAYLVTDAFGFVIVAFFVGMVMGGSQAIARSTYSKMLPIDTHDHTSFFSFYDVMEKVATVVGTFSFGIIEAITGNMRLSVLAVDLFFCISLVFFIWLNRKQQSTQLQN
jgi:UMF1 family MFS transporter